MKPWGRLTLQSGKARMDNDVSAEYIYYTPFEDMRHDEISLYIGGAPMSGLCDVYLTPYNNLEITDPWRVNSKPLLPRLKKGGLWFNGSEDLYIGTILIIEGRCSWEPRPTPQPNGTNNMLGVFNAYNRLPVTAICRDTTSSWQYASDGIRYANNSNLNRISWVDGLGDVFCQGRYECSVAGANLSPAAATVGVGLDYNSYPLNWNGSLEQAALNNNAIGMPVAGTDWTNGSMGLHSWQAMEQSTNVPINFYGNNFMCLTAELCL